MTATADRGPRLFWRLMLWPVTAWLLLLLIGFWPTQALAGNAGVRAMFVAQAAVVLIVYGTLVPALKRMQGASPRAAFQIAFKASGVRFLLTLLVAVAIGWKAQGASVSLVWLAIAYAVMIQVETMVFLRWMKSNE